LGGVNLAGNLKSKSFSPLFTMEIKIAGFWYVYEVNTNDIRGAGKLLVIVFWCVLQFPSP
jgi:hypothetical protein